MVKKEKAKPKSAPSSPKSPKTPPPKDKAKAKKDEGTNAAPVAAPAVASEPEQAQATPPP